MANHAIPVVTWVASPYAGGFLSLAQSKTVAYNLTIAWEGQVLCGIVAGTSISASQEFKFYRSTDGGNSYESEPCAAFSLGPTPSSAETKTISLSTGLYIAEVVASANSLTVFFPTYMVITAVNGNV